MTIEQRLGRNVATLRKISGWTQAELAERLAARGYGMHQSAVAKIEGALRPVPAGELAALAAIFGLKADDLINEPDRDQASASAEYRRVADEFHHARREHEALVAEAEHLSERIRHSADRVEAARARFDAYVGNQQGGQTDTENGEAAGDDGQ